MKKMFTLMAGLLLAAAVFAADRRPVVSVRSFSNFKIVIDGKSYFGNSMNIRLDDFYGNRHLVKVYEMRRGFFARERLVDVTSFRMGRNNVMITVDRFGRIDIREMRDRGRFDRDDRDWNKYDNGYGRDDKGWNKNDSRDIRDDKGYDEKDGRDGRDGRGNRF